jgi:hypothetical protein
MTGIGRSVNRAVKKYVPKEVRRADPLSKPLEKGVAKTRFGPKIPQPAEEKIIPLPDEDALSVARRRRSARRQGSRASTVLSLGGDDDTVG